MKLEFPLIRRGHDAGCGGCYTARDIRENGGCVVFSDAALCKRCGPTYNSSSYLHSVDGKRYCGLCADAVVREGAEAFAVAML